jgi:excinuclease ABC subunit C
VTFQRARRAKRTVTSQLLEIPGVGPNRRRALLKEFGSVQGVREAGLDAVAAVPGFSKLLATKVLTGLGVELPTAPGTATADVASPPPSIDPVPNDDSPE